MPDPSLRQLLEVAIDAAHVAGRRTLGHFNTAMAVETKADQTPVTIADREAEGACAEVIRRHFPGHAVRGEEHVNVGGDERFSWLIDPIDGTKSFIHGVPLYGTLVACLVGGRPSVGVIYLPALDDLIAAADGEGCFWNGRRDRCSGRDGAVRLLRPDQGGHGETDGFPALRGPITSAEFEPPKLEAAAYRLGRPHFDEGVLTRLVEP